MGISFPGLSLKEKGNRFFGLPVFSSRCISTAHTGSFSRIIGIPQTPSGLVSFATGLPVLGRTQGACGLPFVLAAAVCWDELSRAQGNGPALTAHQQL